MTRQTALTLRTRQELLALPQRLSLGQPLYRLSLALPDLAEPERSLAEARLSALLSGCGCNEGAIALVLALPPADYLALASPLAPDGWGRWGMLFGILIVASLAGKAFGLRRARQDLQREIGSLLSRL